MYWHFFVLHTKEYQTFCTKVWGSFEGAPDYRHHYPSTDETRPGQYRAYISTRELYVEVFGEPKSFMRPGATSVEIWTNTRVGSDPSDTSGDSYSGIIDPNLYDSLPTTS